MLKKLICTILLVMMLSLFALAGCDDGDRVKFFANENELREAAPHIYYFDFDLPEMEFSQARALGHGETKNGKTIFEWYEIDYYFESTKFDRINLNIRSSDREVPTYESIEIIDGLECFLINIDLTEGELAGQHWGLGIFFKIENKVYSIALYTVNWLTLNEQEQEFIDYFLEIAEPAIKTRSKY